MARDGDGNRVRTACPRDGAERVGLPQSGRKIRIGHRSSGRDRAQRLPDSLLERSSLQIQWQVGTRGRTFDESDHLRHPPLERCVAANQLCLPKAVLQILHQCLRIIAQQYRTNSLRSRTYQHAAERRLSDRKLYACVASAVAQL
jgi:hypothetical protein